MSTPGGIGVYTRGSGVPEDVRARPWRGVYHHWAGAPSDLGDHLIERVRRSRGDVRAVVRALIDDAPWGWSSCDFDSPEPYSEDDPGLPVSPEDTGNVAFAYVFDLEARRLDAFATHAAAHGERIGSVCFSPAGEPDLPALDLVPEERVEEPALPGPELDAKQLAEMLLDVAGIESLDWVDTSETGDRSLSILFRVITWEGGTISAVVEREWKLVPAAARKEPERVRAFLAALTAFLREDSTRLDPFWIASLDPLRRSGARKQTTFAAQLRALAARNG